MTNETNEPARVQAPRSTFNRDESGELLDLIRTTREAYGRYVREMCYRLDDETVDKAFEASQAAASAVEQWVITRTDYSRPEVSS